MNNLRTKFFEETGYTFPDENTSDKHYVYWLECKAQSKLSKVPPEYLDAALRIVGISFDKGTINKIVDIVELIEEKGGDTSMMDVIKLETKWKNNKQ